jgi:glycosyltransferase involved in cell wall biosynthesis
VLIGLNSAWNVVNFRSGLIRALIYSGYEVVVAAPADEYVEDLVKLGCRFIPLSMNSKGTSPVQDVLLLSQFLKVMRSERPDVFLGFTIKPNVYGSVAAHILGIPVINNIAGLGTVFMQNGWLNKLVRFMYKNALSRSFKVFFQNDDDRRMFVKSGLVSEDLTSRLPGSGVDLQRFSPTPLPGGSKLRFLLVARMLWDKGVGEFVEASKILRERGLDIECCLLGFLDVQNPGAISRKQIDEWVAGGDVLYLGARKDVRDEISQADCVVLPSVYREGTPRSLLEAAAMARPIVTTDSVGCRDVVSDGVNGYLCRPKDASDLADKMALVAGMSATERKVMGLRGRNRVEIEFDERLVINEYLLSINSAISKRLF